ncbi:MAG: type II secretion system protein GspD [Spiribacter salinus]|uniref:Type II secretion system protein GspD n=1 Tax=Spiribacter salinus TaxID=1335746 RepID=A0A540VS37_9GAMM|nr:MAG: type II secretion system protein GspD [Spiribacter salinus]TQE99727.1 MAG: type II secretion system protein GspD [Spiribacter salinus]
MLTTIFITRPRWLRRTLTVVLIGLLPLAGCSNLPPTQQKVAVPLDDSNDTAPPSANRPPEPATEERDQPEPQAAADGPGFLQQGTGVLVGDAPPPRTATAVGEEGITLNFEGADLREVVKVILGDLLSVNYVIADNVRGQATLHTHSPVSREALLPVLESTLQLNGAALISTVEGYQIVPLDNAAREGAQMSVGRRPTDAPGYRIQVVPLQYVGAAALGEVLEPFVPQGASVQVDEARNLLLLAGPSTRLAELLRTIEIFDVDWLAGMSFELYLLERAEPAMVTEEVEKLLNGAGNDLLGGMIRLVPIERLAAVLVIAKRPRYLERARDLLRRFDQEGNGDVRSLQVYPLRYGKATDIAGVLNEVFAANDGRRQNAAEGEAAAGRGPLPEPVPIIADEANNALLVMATSLEYRAVEQAIRKLDIARRQVLVEASIAEVTLSDNLQYGLQWFLRGSLGNNEQQARLTDAGLASSVARGFSYSLTDSDGFVRLLFDALASESKLKILSSPQLLVIDNQTANIRVGDQIPIITRTSSSSTDTDAPLVNEVQFRDTGVLLQVTPRINAGGMVTLEINQEVSEPSADEFAAGNVSILQRTINTSVAVQSGETVLLGGLIRENKNDSLTGIPLLSRLPLLGPLFSRTVDNTTRTELIITITPRVINSGQEARDAARELMQRMQSLELRDSGLTGN